MGDSYAAVSMVNQPSTMSNQMTNKERSIVYRMELLENSSQIETSTGFVSSRVGINALVSDSTEYDSGIRSMVGLLVRDKKQWDTDTHFSDIRTHSSADGLVVRTSMAAYDKVQSTIVLASQVGVEKWVKELKGTQLTWASVTSYEDIDDINIEEISIILVPPFLYNFVISRYPKTAWKRLVISDPGRVRIPNMALSTAGFYWLVTDEPETMVIGKRKYTNRLIKNLVNTDLVGLYERFDGLIVY